MNALLPVYKQDQEILPLANSAQATNDKQHFIAERVGKVYAYVAESFAITLVTALACAKIGFAASVISLITASTSISLLALTAVSVALCVATQMISKEDWALKHASHGLFAVWQGLVLSPLALVNSSAFALASVGTVALTGGLGALSMVLKKSFEKYEKILFIALGVLAVASLGACFLPGAAGAFAGELSLVGGFALFSCFVIFDTHKARSHALDADFDEINHSMGIYLDALNLFVRLWEVANRTQKN